MTSERNVAEPARSHELVPTARRALDAYGGEERWRRARAIELTLSAWGWAFRLKWQRPARRALARLQIAEPHVEITPIDRVGHRGVLEGLGVRIETPGGEVIETRDDPRSRFPYGRRLLWLDTLDQTYFACYALWNYMTLPALLLRRDIAWTELGAGTLEARFPRSLPTHCETQQFHFDPDTGLLRQHDYTAEVFGGWARAAHVVLEHGEWQGVPYTSRRRAFPRGPGGRPRPAPLLVGIEIEDFRME